MLLYVTIRSTDSVGNYYDEVFVINPTPTNYGPTDLALPNNSVAENSTNGTVVGTVVVSDPNVAIRIRFAHRDNTGRRFAIHATTGQITVLDGTKLDFELNPSHNVTVQVTDSGKQFYSETATINLTNQPDVATNVVPSAQTIAEDTAVFNTLNNNRIIISDDAGDVLRVTIGVTHGTLTLSQTTGLTFTTGTNGTASFTVTGTVDNINAALNGLQYNPTANYNGADSLTITTNAETIYQLNLDANLRGHYEFNASSPGTDSSPGGTNSATLNSATVTNDPYHADVLSLTGGGGHASIASNFGNAANITLAAWVNLDNADAQGSQVVQISNRVGLRLDNPTGSMVAYFDNGSGTSSITFDETLEGTGWRHVAFTFDDTLNAMKLYIDGVEVATKTVGTSINYAGASVGTKIGGLGNTAGYDFNGKIDDARIVGRALTAGEIAAIANVPGAATDTDSVAITVTAVNDAPVLDNSGFLSLTTITENDTNNAGNTVAQILASDSGNPITDGDAGAVEGIAIFSTGGANGTWQYNTGAGWTDVGTVSVTSSLLLRSTDSLRYVPNGLDGDTGSIVFCAWDQTTGTAGSKVDTSSYGGTTAFSDATDSAIISVTSINDAPSFHQGTGLVTTGFGAGTLDYINAIAIQPDGKIIAVGYTQNAGNNDFAVARYNSDGSLDTSFGGGTGKVATAIGVGADNANSVRYLPMARSWWLVA
ncbi:MAG: LamG-like jellyroll fold domain-containing protein [Pirellulaceae bacterium]